jgi:GTPase SAR1 family protein
LYSFHPIKYVPTIEDAFQTTSNVNGKALQVEILDNSGNDKYQVLCEANLPSADGFLLVYSIEDRTSFESLKIIHKKILQFHNEQVK